VSKTYSTWIDNRPGMVGKGGNGYDPGAYPRTCGRACPGGQAWTSTCALCPTS
jgi:hypothetical protein